MAIPARYLPDLIEEKEAEVSFLGEMHEGLRDGTCHWTLWNDELTGTGLHDKQEIAAGECASALDAARRELGELTGYAQGMAAGERPGHGGTR